MQGQALTHKRNMVSAAWALERRLQPDSSDIPPEKAGRALQSRSTTLRRRATIPCPYRLACDPQLLATQRSVELDEMLVGIRRHEYASANRERFALISVGFE